MKVTVYGAAWCGPCKILKRVLAEGEVNYTYVDIDEEPNQAKDAGVRGIPTTVVTDENDVVKARIVGSANDIIKRIEDTTNGIK